jgi:hypothetical protein
MFLIRRAGDWISNFDGYARPITLSYDSQKVIPTCFGGCMTIIQCFIFLIWGLSTLPDLINMKWTVNSWIAGNIANGTTPEYIFNQEYMIPAFVIQNSDGVAYNVADDDVWKRFGAYYG